MKKNKSVKNKIIVILGPTASGKTSLAVKLAKKYNGEIISADSRQVYKEMDIGTGKDLNEYKKEKIDYHLIDVVSPKAEFNLAKWLKLTNKAIKDIIARGKIPIVVGGTGLYLQALVDGYNLSSAKPDKKLRAKMEKKNLKQLLEIIKKADYKKWKSLNASERKNKRRLIRYIEIAKENKGERVEVKRSEYEFLLFGLTYRKEILWQKIYKRLIDRLEKENMADEIRRLKKSGLSWKKLESFGLEYKYISLYLQKKLTYNEMAEKLFIAIRQFSRRQMIWFKRWEKMGRKIYWPGDEKKINELLKKFLRK
jgi:tRNA dimethylallyltransferase